VKNAFWKLLVIAASCVALAFMTGCPKKDDAKGKDKAAKKKEGDKKGGEEKGGAEEKKGGEPEEKKGGEPEEKKGGEPEEKKGGEPEEKKGGEPEEKKGGEPTKAGEADCEKICAKQLECAKAAGGPAAEMAEKAAGACKQGCEMAMKSDNPQVKKTFAMYMHCIDKDCKDMAMCLAEAAKKMAEGAADAGGTTGGTTDGEKPKEPEGGTTDGGEKPKEGGDGAKAGDVDCGKVCVKQLECAKAAGGPAAEAAEKAAGACKMGCEAAVKSGQEAAIKSLKAVSSCADKACGVDFAKCMMEAMK
jgi:hypothetical protein